MLVLSRKAGQAILLGPDIEITVLRVEGDQVRLGVKAPRQISVLRRELLEEIRSETSTATVQPQAKAADAGVLKQLSQRIKKPGSAPTPGIPGQGKTSSPSTPSSGTQATQASPPPKQGEGPGEKDR